ncbi:extracellular solute-binding protein [Fredinandcohnia sp. FSL W7-1320]|uniref:extracellular solute-binding protein n=1 Tax=Fredinandcohnia sp. FSL W7-1320 TaxID=2954540 RepID=UPI0030FD860A
MKKFLTLIAFMLLVSSFVVGCASSSSNGGNEKSDNDVVHLKFWGAVPAESGPQEAVDNWNAANPDIQVEYVRYVNDKAGNTKLETSLLAGGEVDVFVNYRIDKLDKRIKAGMAEPLDQFIEKDSFNIEENFGENSIVKIDGKTHYIPAIILNDFVTINKGFLDEANLEVPTDWTWDEYVEYATTLSQGEGPNKRWGSFVGNLEPKIYEWMDKAVKTELGSNAFFKEDGTSNVDHPVFKKYLDTMVNMERELKVQPPFSEAKATKMQGTDLFLTGKAAMNWSGTAAIRSIKNLEDYPHDFVTAFAPPPKMTEDSKYLGGGTGYLDFVAINSRSKNKEAAWKFVKWYVTEGNEPLISGGRVPAWKKADPNKVAELVLGENPEKLFDVDSFKRVVLNQDIDIVVDTKFDNLAEIQKIVEEQGEKVLIGEQTSDEAITEMKKAIDSALE